MSASEADELFRRPDDDDIRRDRWGRPLILAPDGMSESPYTRVSTMANTLSSKEGLSQWKIRTIAMAVAQHTDLAVGFAAADPETKEGRLRLAELEEIALDRGGGTRRRELGTGIHALTERHDRGLPVDHVHDEIRPAYEAYLRATRHVEWVGIEQFVVCDELGVAGTADRFGYRTVGGDGRVQVWDIKSGNIRTTKRTREGYDELKFAMQLAAYANGCLYNPRTYERTPLEEAFGREVNRETGIIMHVNPYPEEGQPYVRTFTVDLRMGMRAAHAARFVDEWRKKKMPAEIITELLMAETLDELNEIYGRTKDRWTEHERRAATLRAEELRNGRAPVGGA